MNADPIIELNVNASKLGRQWLVRGQDVSPDVIDVDPQSTANHLTVVSVPDLGSEAAPMFEAGMAGSGDILDVEQTLHSVFAVKDVPHAAGLAENANVDAFSAPTESPKQQNNPSFEQSALGRPPHLADQISSSPSPVRPPIKGLGTVAVARLITEGIEDQVASFPMATPIVSDINEKPSDWAGSSTDKDKTERTTTQSVVNPLTGDIDVDSTSHHVDSDAISDLTDQILDRYPLASPTLLLFAGSESNTQIDEACAQVAYQLARRDIGNILLIDSEFEESALTEASGTNSCPGLSSLLVSTKDWGSCIVDHGSSNMDFLPIGNDSIGHWQLAGKKLRPLIANLKTRYQFICVSVGDAHGTSARLWAGECEGTFLVVSMTNSSQTVAKSAVEHLQSQGARMLGCIVTNAL